MQNETLMKGRGQHSKYLPYAFTEKGVAMLKEQLKEIKERLGEHDVQLNHINDAMENRLDEKAAQRKWDDREIIGFKKKRVSRNKRTPWRTRGLLSVLPNLGFYKY